MATRPIPSSTTAPRTITTAEAVARLETVIDSVAAGEGDVILERDGTPKAVVVSMEDYRTTLALREQERKAAAARWLREFQASYDGRNDDLTEDEIERIADEVVRDAVASMAEKGVIRFRSDRDDRQ